jgi:hypothetical protein
LREELEAVDWYAQRAEAASDWALRAILEHNRDEEKEHAADAAAQERIGHDFDALLDPRSATSGSGPENGLYNNRFHPCQKIFEIAKYNHNKTTILSFNYTTNFSTTLNVTTFVNTESCNNRISWSNTSQSGNSYRGGNVRGTS